MPEEPKWTFSVTPSVGIYTLHGSHSAVTPLLGIKASYDLIGKSIADSLGIEATLNYFTSSSTSGYLGRIDAIYPFTPKKKIVPFLAVGVGGIRVTDDTKTDTSPLLNYGVGVKYLLEDYLMLRFDARQHFVYKDVNTHNNFEFSAGLTYLFGKEHKKKPTTVAKPKGAEAKKPAPPPSLSREAAEAPAKTVQKLGIRGGLLPEIVPPAAPFGPPAPPLRPDAIGKIKEVPPAPPAPAEQERKRPSYEEEEPAPTPAAPAAPPAAAPPTPAAPPAAAAPTPATPAAPPAAAAPTPATPTPEAKPAVPATPVAPAPVAPTTPSPVAPIAPAPVPAPPAAVAPQRHAAPVAPAPAAPSARPAAPPAEVKPPAPPAVEAPEEETATDELESQVEEPAGVAAEKAQMRKTAAAPLPKRLTVEFEVDSWTVEEQYLKPIKAWAELLKKYPKATITIEGHTDSTGSSAANMKLSRKRAESVKFVLVKFGAADARRVKIKGYGASRPIADNKTEAGRRKNRRAIVVTMSFGPTSR